MAITGPRRCSHPDENCHTRTQEAPDTFRPGFFSICCTAARRNPYRAVCHCEGHSPGEEFESVGKRALQMGHWSSWWCTHHGTSSPESHPHSYPEVLLRTSTGRTLISAASCQNCGNWQAKTQESQRYHGRPYTCLWPYEQLSSWKTHGVSGSMEINLQLITCSLIKKKKRLIFRDESKLWVIAPPLLTGYLK